MKTSMLLFGALALVVMLNTSTQAQQPWVKASATLAINIVASPTGDFIRDWHNPAMQNKVEIPPLREARPDQAFFAAFLVSGFSCAPSGRYRFTIDWKLQKPDGSLMFNQKRYVVQEGLCKSPQSWIMGDNTIKLTLESSDPRGAYALIAAVTDEVSAMTRVNEFKFILADSVAAAQPSNDLHKQMTYFYLSPSKEEFESFQRNADKSQSEFQAHGNGPVDLIAVMIAKISGKNKWPIVSRAFGTRAEEILGGQSPFAKYVIDDSQVDPTKLDIWWASFLATGDEQYLDKVFRYAGQDPAKSSGDQMLIVGAAGWSFRSNCKQHKRIVAFAQSKLASSSLTASQRKLLEECVAARPSR